MSRTLGFSLVEVMIALIIISVGMLGIAKLEAVVLSSTGTSRIRALVALQAESLADAMHADRDFWDGGSGDWTSSVGVSVTVAASSATLSATNSAHLASALTASPNCTATCSPVNLAGYDLTQWASGSAGFGGLAQLLKSSTASISCLAQTVLNPASCTVTINWNENTVAANQQEAQAGAPTSFQSETYTLVVQP
ncbi:MAG: prepilin-type N-terminal cleavage/methylation domain-containing protein [Steroidobacteraceae bacterium]